jgi:hypothetical protein
MKSTNFDELNQFQKIQAFAAYKSQIERFEFERPIREAYDTKYSRLGEIKIINDWLVIAEHIELTGDRKTYFAAIVDGRKMSSLADSEVGAILIGLGVKYDGLNSQFAHFAARMLPGFV